MHNCILIFSLISIGACKQLWHVHRFQVLTCKAPLGFRLRAQGILEATQEDLDQKEDSSAIFDNGKGNHFLQTPMQVLDSRDMLIP